MPTIPAENGFSKIEFRENTKVLNSPSESELVDIIQNNEEDIMITGQAPVISRPLEPRFDYNRTIASVDSKLIVDVTNHPNENAWVFKPGSKKGRLCLSGIGAIQENQSNNSTGINLRCIGVPGLGVEDILIEDCYFRGLDGSIALVDDYARTSDNNDNGRLTASIRRNICLDSIGLDSHAVHLYLEGTRNGTFVEDCVFHKAGWVDSRDTLSLSDHGDADDVEANHREHCIYGQSINQRINLYNNFFGEAGANAYQLRAGGHAIGNVLWRCPVGGYHAGTNAQKIIHNIQIDQVDINSIEGNAGRGHGFFIAYSSGHEFRENIIARKHGSLRRRPGIEASSSCSVIRNHIYDWGPEESKYISGGDPSKTSGNIIKPEGSDGDLPAITESMVEVWRNRGIREWDDKNNHITYRNKVQEIVFLGRD